MITCEECTAFTMPPEDFFTKRTSAERVAVARHASRCPQCYERLKKDAMDAAKRLEMSAIVTADLAGAALALRDLQDPENQVSE